jgi:hypothetical protein
MVGMRVVAAPAAIDVARFADGARVLRLAPDEVFVVGSDEVAISDPHAIVVRDAGVVGAWVEDPDSALAPLLEWPLPGERPVVASGSLGGIGVRIWLEHDRALVLASAAVATELAELLP